MKQRITTEQLNELDDKAKAKLREWWKPKVGDLYCNYLDEGNNNWSVYLGKVHHYEGFEVLPLLSIGQMLEFLEDYSYKDSGYLEAKIDNVRYSNYSTFVIGWDGKELCDSLWSAVKYILTKDL